MHQKTRPERQVSRCQLAGAQKAIIGFQKFFFLGGLIFLILIFHKTWLQMSTFQKTVGANTPTEPALSKSQETTIQKYSPNQTLLCLVSKLQMD